MDYRSPHHRGQWAEASAEAWLTEQGLTPHQRNFRRRVGEIDLILKDMPSQQWVFVEVKYRQRNARVPGAEAIGYHKQKKLLLTARLFLAHQHEANYGARFDALIITATPDSERYERRSMSNQTCSPTESAEPQDPLSSYDVQWLKNVLTT